MEQSAALPRKWTAPFFTIWAAQVLSLFGSSVAGFALIWWLTRTTGSATVLATATLVSMLPGIVLGPFAGALVDRWSRRWVMVVADGGIALFSAWLAYLFWRGSIQPWHVFVIMLARSVGGCFHFPAMQASTSLMVPKDQLQRVAGMNQTLNGGMNIVAPPLGALLISILPLHAVMMIDVVTAATAIAPLFFVRIPQPERTGAAGQGTPRTTYWQDLLEGLRYVWGWTGLCLVGLMATLINLLLNPAFSLVPILVTKHFHGQALQLGWMESAFGFGVVAGGLTLSAWGGFRRRMWTSMAGLFGMGLATALVGLTPAGALWLAVAGMFLAGFTNPIANGPLFAVMQATVAPDKQGRVFTLLGSASSAASPLGLLIAGPVSDALGVGAWFVMGGVMCLVMAAGAFFIPAIVHLEDRAAPSASSS